MAQEAAQRISVACQRAVAAQLMRSVAGQAPLMPVHAGGSAAPSELGEDIVAEAAMEP